MANDSDDNMRGHRGEPCEGRTICLSRPRTRRGRRADVDLVDVRTPLMTRSSSYSDSGKDPTMTSPQDNPIDPWVRTEVSRIWREWVGMDPQMPPAQREALIDQEAARLTEMIEETVGDSAHGFLVEQWRQEHPGQDPDHQTTVALIETAWSSARTKILETELYPQVSAEASQQTGAEMAHLAESALRRARVLKDARDPERWRRGMVDPTELATRIVDRVWGYAGSMEFQELALALVQQRLDDNLPTPATSADPLREELELMIDTELNRNNATS